MAASTEWAIAVNNVARHNPRLWATTTAQQTCSLCGLDKPKDNFPVFKNNKRGRVCYACRGTK